MTLILASNQIARDDPASFSVDHDQIQHLATRVHVDVAETDLATHGLIGTQQELLSSLATGIERSGDLRTTERAVVQEAAILTGKRYTLRDTLINDVVRYLRQAVHVRFA